MTKEIYRKQMKAKLLLIDKESFTDQSSLISKNLSQLVGSLNVIQEKMIIGAFAPIALEPLWYLGQSSEIEMLTAYPAFSAVKDLMTFRMARMRDLVIKKEFGFEILGPTQDSLEVVPGLILVPGLGFAESGERLGRGKGFYDKYLTHFRGIKIGICFSAQIENTLPTEKHDVALDYVITDKRIINCKRK